MLGNDIVDYSCDEKKYLNRRFVNRILSKTEIKYLSQSKNQNAFLWSLWAAKEASFKAYQKTNLQSIFSPSQYQSEPNTLEALLKHDFQKSIQATLTYQNHTIHLLFSWPNQTTVHCVAHLGPSSLSAQIQTNITNQWDERIDGNQSSQVRAVANKLLIHNQITAHIKRPELTMPGYNKPGPPVLISQADKKLPHEISLSHDGTWLAAALLCRRVDTD